MNDESVCIGNPGEDMFHFRDFWYQVNDLV